MKINLASHLRLSPQHLAPLKPAHAGGDTADFEPAAYGHERRSSLTKAALFARQSSFSSVASGGTEARAALGGAAGPAHAAEADLKVEERHCRQCTAAGAVPGLASWADPNLGCGLFVADVKMLAKSSKTAKTAKTSLAKRLQKSSPSGSVKAVSSTTSLNNDFGTVIPGRRNSTSLSQASTGFRWGGSAIAPDVNGTTSASARPPQEESPPGHPYVVDAQDAAVADLFVRRELAPGTVLPAVTVPGRPGPPSIGMRSVSPSTMYRNEPIGRSPSPVPRG